MHSVIKYFLSINPDRILGLERKSDLIPINFRDFHFH